MNQYGLENSDEIYTQEAEVLIDFGYDPADFFITACYPDYNGYTVIIGHKYDDSFKATEIIKDYFDFETEGSPSDHDYIYFGEDSYDA